MTEDTTAEYASPDLLPPVDLRYRPVVTVACKTDLGRVRENNEDKFEFFLPEEERALATRGLVFLVCDGMGGHAAGQIASELTCKTFIDVYLHHPSEDPEVAARAAATAANRFVIDVSRAVPGRSGMGTTLSALLLIQDRALVVQVGDSRIYRLRTGACTLLTTDHTWVEEAIASGVIQASEASTHPYRHVLTRAIGTEATVTPDVFWADVQVGDTYLLCSDGVMNHVSDGEIEDVLARHAPPMAAWKLVAQALADGGSDNTTVVVVRVDDLVQP
ncbi:MAG TPA: protein phosphatase 2C domain-containing protein [Fimbriimonadaceae bacterium]|nr:protein phosphatase 2C domain-containing protein [Fimbriimonadaceae bacterium]